MTSIDILFIVFVCGIPTVIYGTCKLIQYLAYNRGWKCLRKLADKIGD